MWGTGQMRDGGDEGGGADGEEDKRAREAREGEGDGVRQTLG